MKEARDIASLYSPTAYPACRRVELVRDFGKYAADVAGFRNGGNMIWENGIAVSGIVPNIFGV